MVLRVSRAEGAARRGIAVSSLTHGTPPASAVPATKRVAEGEEDHPPSGSPLAGAGNGAPEGRKQRTPPETFAVSPAPAPWACEEGAPATVNGRPPPAQPGLTNTEALTDKYVLPHNAFFYKLKVRFAELRSRKPDAM